MKNQGIIFILLFLLSSCQKTVFPPEPKVDDQWTYRYTTYDESGNVTGTIDKNFTAFGFNIESSKRVEPWVSIKQDGLNANTGFPCGDYRLEENGLYVISSYGVLRAPDPFIPYPGTVGGAFSHYDNGIVSTTTIVSTNDTATVPFGFFSGLYQLEYLNVSGAHDRIWFNDSVWFVKFEMIDSLTIGTGTYVSESIELVNYTAN